MPQEEDVLYVKFDIALLTRPDIAKLILESENQEEQANNSVAVGANTSTTSVSKEPFVPPQHPPGLSQATPALLMHPQTVPIVPIMPVHTNKGFLCKLL